MAKVKNLVIRLLVFLLMAAVVEAGARYFEPRLRKPKVDLLMTMQPYLMFTANSGGGFKWLNVLDHNKVIPSTMVFNNYGFSEAFDYTMVPDEEYLARYGKKPGEKIVLLTGGSVVHGVGATGNDKTIAARMQHYLNKNGGGTKWRVINIAMGSWIAYQQFLGLSLFGLPFNPDWVVSMDGHNDAAVPCAHGSGVANPLGWPHVLYMEQGGMDADTHQGPLQRAARYSATVRVLTGVDAARVHEKPIPTGLIRDAEDPDPRFLIKLANLTFSAQDQQLAFYLQSERDVLALFSKANVVMSTQPVMYDNALGLAYRKAFAPGATKKDLAELEHDDDDYMGKHRQDKCGSQLSSPLLGYFLGKSADRLKDLMEQGQAADHSRKLLYYNTEWSMPPEVDLRRPFFIDNAHMSDRGQDRVGEFFADIVLSGERNKDFDFAAFVDRHRQPSPVDARASN